MSKTYKYSGLTEELYQRLVSDKKRPRLMPRTVQTLIILSYHKGTDL